MSFLFIEDGYTATKSVEAKPGFHPAYVVRFRPASSLKRDEYRKVVKADNPERTDDWKAGFLAAYVQELDGAPLPKARVGKLHPLVYDFLMDTVMNYEAHDEDADVKN